MRRTENLATFMCLEIWDPKLPECLKVCPDLYRDCFDGQYTYKRNIEARSRNHCYHIKARNITYSECVSVALVIQHAKGMRLVTLSSAVCLAVPYFSTSSHKRHNFLKKVIEHKDCVLIPSTNLVWKFSRSRKNSASYFHKCTNVVM